VEKANTIFTSRHDRLSAYFSLTGHLCFGALLVQPTPDILDLVRYYPFVDLSANFEEH